jgi:tetratricopeptide (TPR) repeat protein
VPVLDGLGDQLGLARSWYLLAQAHWTSLQARQTAAALELAFDHALGAGDRRERSKVLTFLVTTIIHGPSPVGEGLLRCEEIHEQGEGNRTVESAALRARARLVAMLGRFDEARDLMAKGRAILAELGLTVYEAGSAEGAAFIELLADAPSRADEILVGACRRLEQIGDRGYLPTLTAYRAEALYRQGRYEHAERETRISEQTAAADDLATYVVLRSVRSKLLARRGHVAAAERVAREAVTLTGETDFLNLRADALAALAEVLSRSDSREGERVAQLARSFYAKKGNAVSAGRLAAGVGIEQR